MGSVGKDGSSESDVKKPNTRTGEHFQITFHFGKGVLRPLQTSSRGKVIFLQVRLWHGGGLGGGKEMQFPFMLLTVSRQERRLAKEQGHSRVHVPLKNLKMVQFQVRLPFGIQWLL